MSGESGMSPGEARAFGEALETHVAKLLHQGDARSAERPELPKIQTASIEISEEMRRALAERNAPQRFPGASLWLCTREIFKSATSAFRGPHSHKRNGQPTKFFDI